MMPSSTSSSAHLNPRAAPDTTSFALSWESQGTRPHVLTPSISVAGTTVTTKSKAAGFVSLMKQIGSLDSWKISFFFKDKVYQKGSVQKKDLLAQTGLLQLQLAAQWLLEAEGKANQIMCLTAGNLMGRLPSHSPQLKTSSNLKLIWQSSVAGKCTTYIFLDIVYLVNDTLNSEGTTIRYFSFLR